MKLLEKQLMTKFFCSKKTIFPPKMVAPSKKVKALNLYIDAKVLVYERWLVVKVWYLAGRPTQHILTLHINVSQKSLIFIITSELKPILISCYV